MYIMTDTIHCLGKRKTALDMWLECTDLHWKVAYDMWANVQLKTIRLDGKKTTFISKHLFIELGNGSLICIPLRRGLCIPCYI